MSIPPLTIPLGRYLRRRGIPPLTTTAAWLNQLAVALDAGASPPSTAADLVVVPTAGRWLLRPGPPKPNATADMLAVTPAVAFTLAARALLTGRIAGPGSLDLRLPPSELRPGLPAAVDDILGASARNCRATAAALSVVLSHVACAPDIMA